MKKRLYKLIAVLTVFALVFCDRGIISMADEIVPGDFAEVQEDKVYDEADTKSKTVSGNEADAESKTVSGNEVNSESEDESYNDSNAEPENESYNNANAESEEISDDETEYEVPDSADSGAEEDEIIGEEDADDYEESEEDISIEELEIEEEDVSIEELEIEEEDVSGDVVSIETNNSKTAPGLVVSPKADGTIKINLLVASIDPTLTSINGRNYHNGKNTIKASEYFNYSLAERVGFWCDSFEEVSHQTVEFNVVDTVEINEFPKYKADSSLPSLNNKSFQELFKMDENGYGMWYEGITSEAYRQYDTAGDLDYEYYIEKLDLVKKKNAGEFDVLLMIGIDPLSPNETCMVGRNPLWINGDTFCADCENFVIVTPTFSRPDGSIENVGHMSEAMLGYTYGNIDYVPGCIDGSNYNALNDWQKFCLCKYLATPGTSVYGYGMVHFSPNSDDDYDWENDTPVNYYKNWREGTGKSTFTAQSTYLAENSPYNYPNNPCISHHKWWFSNMPYEDGRDEDGYFNNWWRYIFTPDYVTGLSQVKENPQGKIDMKIGDETAVDFMVEYYSDTKIATDTAESDAAIILKKDSHLSVKEGKIVALTEGKETIEIRLDGISLFVSVSISDVRTAYNISYELNGGNNSKDNPKSYGVNKTVTLKNPKRTGYTFDGWYDNKSFTGDKIKEVKKQDITLYAKWIPNTYTITLNGKGGKYTPAGGEAVSTFKMNLTYDSEAALSTKFVRTGYTLSGFTTKKDGKGKFYAFAEKVKNLTKTNKGNVNLYAKWTPNPYTVVFDTNVEAGVKVFGLMNPLNTKYGKNVKLPASEYVRKGYSFKGWSLTPDGEVRFKNKAKVKNLATSGEVRLYAVWSLNTYSVKFSANGGKGKVPDTIKGRQYGVNPCILPVKDSSLHNDGYTFRGWSTTKDDSDLRYEEGEVFDYGPIKENYVVTLYAQWDYDICVQKDDGTTDSFSASINRVYTTEYLADLVFKLNRPGEHVVGFATSEKNAAKGKLAYKSTVKNAAGKILYPVYKPNKYTVKFDKNVPEGAKVTGKMSSQAATYGKSFTLKGNEYKCAGHKFLGWDRKQNATVPEFTNKAQITTSLSDKNKDVVVLYAIWD